MNKKIKNQKFNHSSTVLETGFNNSLVLFQARLEEYKIGHKQEEEGMEDDITSLEDKLLDVKSTLESR